MAKPTMHDLRLALASTIPVLETFTERLEQDDQYGPTCTLVRDLQRRQRDLWALLEATSATPKIKTTPNETAVPPTPGDAATDDERREYFKHTGPYHDALFYLTNCKSLPSDVYSGLRSFADDVEHGRAGALSAQKTRVFRLIDQWRRATDGLQPGDPVWLPDNRFGRVPNGTIRYGVKYGDGQYLAPEGKYGASWMIIYQDDPARPGYQHPYVLDDGETSAGEYLYSNCIIRPISERPATEATS